jgi:hypothetical protein
MGPSVSIEHKLPLQIDPWNFAPPTDALASVVQQVIRAVVFVLEHCD